MSRPEGRARIGYLTAVFAVVACFGFMETWPEIAAQGRSLILLASVTAVAAAGGFGPAMLTLATSTPMLLPGSEWSLTPPHQVRLALFFGLGTIIATASHLLRRASRQREELIERQAMEHEAAKRRETERVLREMDRRLGALVDSNVIGVVLLEGDRIIDANRAFVEILAADRPAVLGRTLSSFTFDADHERDLEALDELEDTGRYESYEKRFVTEDGRRRHVLVAGARIEGTGQRSIAFVHDLEDRKRHEAEREDLLAREQSARLAAETASDNASFLAEATATLAATLDEHDALERVADLVVSRFADACRIDLRRDEGSQERIDRTRDATTASDAESPWTFDVEGESVEDVIARTLRTGTTTWVPWTSASGRGSSEAATPRSFVCVPIKLREHTLGALSLCTAPDSDRLYTLEEVRVAEELGARCAVAVENASLYAQVREARAEAEAASRAREQFLATLSHELRTPMNTNSILVDLLRSGRMPEDRRGEALETIRRNMRVQLRLLEDLLDTSRVISGKLTIELEPLSLGECVRGAVESVRPTIDSKRLRVAVEGDDALVVRADPQRLAQVLVNIVGNAAKFTPEGGLVRITVGVEDDEAVIRVTDDGEGIDPELLPWVFEPFRGSGAGNDGLGLGLAIAHRIVDLHGGVLEASSEGRGRGATFTIRLPRFESAEVDAPAERTLDGIRLLVASGGRDSQRSTGASLAALGADVTIVGSAAEALRTVADDRPDALVAETPGLDSTEPELLARLRQAEQEGGQRSLPVLSITQTAGENDDQDLPPGLARAPRSTEPEGLVQKIRSLLGRSE